MIKAFLRISILALACMTATQAVRAQQPMLVNVPFAFTAGNVALPAGEYWVEKPAVDSPAVVLHRTDGSAAAVVMSFAASPEAQQVLPRLVFHRYGDNYFLSQVWTADSLRGRQLPVTTSEKEQSLLAHHAKADQVAIAGRIAPPKS